VCGIGGIDLDDVMVHQIARITLLEGIVPGEIGAAPLAVEAGLHVEKVEGIFALRTVPSRRFVVGHEGPFPGDLVVGYPQHLVDADLMLFGMLGEDLFQVSL
jgi:hypothetical protein